MASTNLLPATYPASAKHRIASLGTEKVKAFIRELPRKDLQDFIANRPSIDGFRKTTTQGADRHITQFVSSLCHAADAKPKINEVDWHALTGLWRLWAIRTVGRAYFLADFSVPGSADSDEGFLTAILKQAADKGIAREDLLRLLQFAPFEQTIAGTRLAEQCPSKEEIKQRSVLAELPNQIAELREKAVSHEAALSELKKNGKLVSEKLEEILHTKRSESNSIESFIKRLAAVEKRLDQPVTLPPSVDKQLAADRATLSKTVSSVEKFVTASNGQLSKFGQANTGVIDQISGLETRLANAELCLQALAEPSPAPQSGQNDSRLQTIREISTAAYPGPCIVQLKQEGTQYEIKKLADLFELLRENLVAAGLDSHDASVVGAIATAGLVTNQLVQFKGSLADYASVAVATSISRLAVLGWHVPLGLTDVHLSKSILEVGPTGQDGNASIVLYGANRSAFEIYGGPIRSSIIMSQMGAASEGPRHTFIASWAEGPAVYDLCSPLVELGPVIDTDDLQWSVARLAKRRLGILTDKQGTVLATSVTSSQAAEDVLTDVSGIMSLSTPLRRRIVHRAAMVLCQLFPSDESAVKAALLTGWLPHWLSCNRVGIDEFRAESDAILRELPIKSLLNTALIKLQQRQAA
jgi:hypothetical protein